MVRQGDFTTEHNVAKTTSDLIFWVLNETRKSLKIVNEQEEKGPLHRSIRPSLLKAGSEGIAGVFLTVPRKERNGYAKGPSKCSLGALLLMMERRITIGQGLITSPDAIEFPKQIRKEQFDSQIRLPIGGDPVRKAVRIAGWKTLQFAFLWG